MANIFDDNYIATLSGDDYRRYLVKVNMCGGVDPFKLDLNTLLDDPAALPAVAALDVLTFLVDTADYLSKEQFKRYKSTEAHTYFTDGWIQFIKSKPLASEKIVVCSRVSVCLRSSGGPP